MRSMYHLYFHRVLPQVGGWISGDPEAYRYLPESVEHFPGPEVFRQKLLDAGFSKVRYKRLTGGIACLHLAER
jgi:demethylmenaquinone methyltransferase/2-methoxy-6-polyprenyl-1,4-benzoquinol methylase